MGNKHKSAVSMAVVSGAGLVLMGLNAQTVSAATNAPANVIRSTNTVTIDGKTYNITQEQYTNNDSDSNTGNETYHPAPVVQDTRPVSDFFDTDDNGNSIVSKVDQQELQQKQAQAEKLVAQQAAAEQAKAQAQQQADIDEADAKAVTQQELQQKQQAEKLVGQKTVNDKVAVQKIPDQKDSQSKVDAKDPKKIYDKLQAQYQKEFDATYPDYNSSVLIDNNGPVSYESKVDKKAGVSAYGKTDRIRGIAAILNQYYPVINIGDNEGNPFTFGSGLDDTWNYVVYYRQTGETTDTSEDKIIKAFEYDKVSGQVVYSNLSKSTASAELIAKYQGFKPVIANDIIAAMIDNEGVITYIHPNGKDNTLDPNVKVDSTGRFLAPVYPVDIVNAIANPESLAPTVPATSIKPNESNGNGSTESKNSVNPLTPIVPVKPTAPSTEATPQASEPLKTRAEVQANIAAQKVAAKSAAKAAKKATRKASTATVVPATFAVNDLTQAANSNHVNVSSPVNTIISRSSVANTDNHDNLPKTGVSNDSKTNNLGIFASVLALISAAVLGLKKKFN
ncbi:LPXTG cell wall anchor domain-containing protein [Leuconostoc kimchii]|uniref:Gram-positive cocci surface proteins LPxTG domain-containing protein n=2 Tax=Leuconostoc kimchii TaxID=136609 RepID=D5T1X7_LEUKI|nr:LPXTG cell wall anchor domain-containing protein [Leuconostoc kimchii]ADG40276.1 hypothetical protein LKI_03670 [Leuconostoc kimchii IMSNU 11154]QBR46792.1 hypothetical protein EW139_01085 [Leuconostoc kimchii]